MRENLEQRAEELAVYIIENRATIRAAAKHFGVSKSTVHKDLSERLEQVNRSLWQQAKKFWSKTRPNATSAAGTPRAPNTKSGVPARRLPSEKRKAPLCL